MGAYGVRSAVLRGPVLLSLIACIATGCGAANPRGATAIAPATAQASPIAGSASPDAATHSGSATTEPATDSPPATSGCPNPHGGVCLGPIDAGTYSTASFEAGLTYSVPDGWDNEEDLPGNFLLLPPGADIDGVDAGTSDYLGVYSRVAPNPQCKPTKGQPSAGAEAAAECIAARDDLVTTKPEPVEIGGLSGYVLDVKLPPAATEGTSLIVGISPSSLDHGVIPGLTIRLYLLDFDGTALAIEVDDVNAANLDEYSAVVEQFSLEP